MLPIIKNTPEMLLADYDLSLFPIRNDQIATVREMLISYFSRDYLKTIRDGKLPDDIDMFKRIPTVIGIWMNNPKHANIFTDTAPRTQNAQPIPDELLAEFAVWVHKNYQSFHFQEHLISFRDILNHFKSQTKMSIRSQYIRSFAQYLWTHVLVLPSYSVDPEAVVFPYELRDKRLDTHPGIDFGHECFERCS